MDMRIERVVLETEQQTITGDVHLPREGYRSRLSDYLNRSDDDFVPLSNVTIRSRNGVGRTEEREFLAVSRRHITLAYPARDDER
jgi:hypothetical protein